MSPQPNIALRSMSESAYVFDSCERGLTRTKSDVPRIMTSMLTLKRSDVSMMAAEKTDAANVTVSVKPAAVMVMRNLRHRGLDYHV